MPRYSMDMVSIDDLCDSFFTSQVLFLDKLNLQETNHSQFRELKFDDVIWSSSLIIKSYSYY